MILLPVVAALAGLVIGLRTRALIARYAPAEGEPSRPSRSPSPVVPVVTALALGALALRALADRPASGAFFPPDATWVGELLAFWWLAVITVMLAFIDLAVYRLPDRLTLAAYLGTGGLLAAAALAGGRLDDLLRAGLAGAALAAFYLALFLVNPAGMGLGDVKLAASLGTALGWLGWDSVVIGAFLGFVAGGLYGVALMAAGRAGRKSEIPFGPFMIIGAFAAILV
ncbi:prepilin peptidase [Streptosporangium subroseum]|uniref:prepilin peptidase n=1 Tax=Streptosporangium subroseum TaxID=106412 RepID=UPI0015C596AA|nr:A24 family peptidase [Streptosporangium subroseum]